MFLAGENPDSVFDTILKISPEDEDGVSYIQIELLEQVLVALRPSLFLLVFLKIEISLIRAWEYLFKKEDP